MQETFERDKNPFYREVRHKVENKLERRRSPFRVIGDEEKIKKKHFFTEKKRCKGKREGVEEEEDKNREILNFFRLLMNEYTAVRIKNQELLKVIRESELVYILY